MLVLVTMVKVLIKYTKEINFFKEKVKNGSKKQCDIRDYVSRSVYIYLEKYCETP